MDPSGHSRPRTVAPSNRPPASSPSIGGSRSLAASSPPRCATVSSAANAARTWKRSSEERLICLAPISHSAWSIRPTLIGPGCQGVNGPWKPNQSADQREDRTLPPHPGRRAGPSRSSTPPRTTAAQRCSMGAPVQPPPAPLSDREGHHPSPGWTTWLDITAGEVHKRGVAGAGQDPRYEDRGVGLSVEQARTLLEASKTDRLHALYVLAVYLGLRRGVAARASVGGHRPGRRVPPGQAHPQRVNGELRFQPPKTRHCTPDEIPLPSPCLEVLRAHRVARGAGAAGHGD